MNLSEEKWCMTGSSQWFHFHRKRFTAEECLKHQWLQLKEEEVQEESVSEPVSHDDEADEEESAQVTEELIVMAAYTLGQCRQSSDKESLTPDRKAISKRFKFEEPFSALQEVPGEFIYWSQASQILPTNAALHTRILVFVFSLTLWFQLVSQTIFFWSRFVSLVLFFLCTVCAALYLHGWVTDVTLTFVFPLGAMLKSWNKMGNKLNRYICSFDDSSFWFYLDVFPCHLCSNECCLFSGVWVQIEFTVHV